MKKIFWPLVVIVVLLLLLPPVLGQLAVAKFEQFVQQQYERSGYPSELIEVSHGWFSGEVTTYSDFGLDEPIVMTHQLNYGPVTLDGKLALATMISELKLQAPHPDLTAQLGRLSPIYIDTTFQYSGAMKAHFEMPSFNIEHPDESLKFTGLSGFVHQSGDLIEGVLYIPSIQLMTPISRIELHNARINIDYTWLDDITGLFSGKNSIEVEKVMFTNSEHDDTFGATNLLFRVSGAKQGRKLDIAISGNFDGLLMNHSEGLSKGKVNATIKNISAMQWREMLITQKLKAMRNNQIEQEVRHLPMFSNASIRLHELTLWKDSEIFKIHGVVGFPAIDFNSLPGEVLEGVNGSVFLESQETPLFTVLASLGYDPRATVSVWLDNGLLSQKSNQIYGTEWVIENGLLMTESVEVTLEQLFFISDE